MSISDFKRENRDVIKRVYDEAISIFNYELSTIQMVSAIQVYFNTKFKPSSVEETEVYTIN